VDILHVHEPPGTFDPLLGDVTGNTVDSELNGIGSLDRIGSIRKIEDVGWSMAIHAGDPEDVEELRVAAGAEGFPERTCHGLVVKGLHPLGCDWRVALDAALASEGSVKGRRTHLE
jgi:hypothetical protein